MTKKLAVRLGALAALALAGHAPAEAAEPGYRDQDVVRGIDEAALARLVRAEGHAVDELHPIAAPSVNGRTTDGLMFMLIGTACAEDGLSDCQGILMQVRFDSDATVTIDGINQANLNEAAVTTWWDKSDNTVGFQRHVILDDGVTWANIRANLRVLLEVYGGAANYVFR